MLQQTRLLNSQTGAWLDVQVIHQGQEAFQTGARQVPAERYQVLADEQRITLWYAADDHRWIGLESLTDTGYTLRYGLSQP